MQTILFLQDIEAFGSRLRLEGLGLFAKEIGWNVQCCEENPDVSSLQLLNDLWNPVGTILSVNATNTEYDATLFSASKTVLVDCQPPPGLEQFAMVKTDNLPVTELVARELLGSTCAAYGFVPWPYRRIWSESRRQHFTHILKQSGIPLQEFHPSREGLNNRDTQRELIPWLRALPKPCGIFAANDRVAENVLQACHLARIVVPFDCMVVGVDNNADVCDRTDPTLSSVALDFRTSGYRAGELLYKLITHQINDRPTVSVPPLGFTRRNSSRIFLRTDHAALQASELIRLKACQGLSAGDVLAQFPCSRRLAEMRFRKATGHTVRDEIQNVRIEHAKQLLQNPFQRLDTIAEQCGYESDTTFRRLFKEKTGLTLRQWQKTRRGGL